MEELVTEKWTAADITNHPVHALPAQPLLVTFSLPSLSTSISKWFSKPRPLNLCEAVKGFWAHVKPFWNKDSLSKVQWPSPKASQPWSSSKTTQKLNQKLQWIPSSIWGIYKCQGVASFGTSPIEHIIAHRNIPFHLHRSLWSCWTLNRQSSSWWDGRSTALILWAWEFSKEFQITEIQWPKLDPVTGFAL